MEAPKSPFVAKFKRKRKEFRLTHYTQHWLDALTKYYESSETAIVEAAVLSFGERYLGAMNNCDEFDDENLQFVEEANELEKMTKNVREL